jgi:hypothetical protein
MAPEEKKQGLDHWSLAAHGSMVRCDPKKQLDRFAACNTREESS